MEWSSGQWLHQAEALWGTALQYTAQHSTPQYSKEQDSVA
jgi:hypothetical protein